MVKLRPVILLLAFALLIQNTCPHGFAGKTTVVPTCGNCKVKKLHGPSFDAQKKMISGSSVHFPLFVFSIPKTNHTFQLGLLTSIRPVLTDQYTDAEPAELLRPPQA